MQISKLVLLRGNSGSGKSTIAKAIREKSAEKIAWVEQDYIRRIILKEKDTPEGINGDLILQTVEFALAHHYHVILEGIFYTKHYWKMFDKIFTLHPDNNFIYYFAISFEETLRRHATKPNNNDFGEVEMRRWYNENDVLGVNGEKIIPESFTLEQTVAEIAKDTGLC